MAIPVGLELHGRDRGDVFGASLGSAAISFMYLHLAMVKLKTSTGLGGQCVQEFGLRQGLMGLCAVCMTDPSANVWGVATHYLPLVGTKYSVGRLVGAVLLQTNNHACQL